MGEEERSEVVINLAVHQDNDDEARRLLGDRLREAQKYLGRKQEDEHPTLHRGPRTLPLLLSKISYLTGAARGIRTPDPLITNEVLCQLSYCGDRPWSGMRPCVSGLLVHPAQAVHQSDTGGHRRRTVAGGSVRFRQTFAPPGGAAWHSIVERKD